MVMRQVTPGGSKCDTGYPRRSTILRGTTDRQKSAGVATDRRDSKRITKRVGKNQTEVENKSEIMDFSK